MLATILKGGEATVATLRIIETYAKMKDAGRNLRQMINEDKEEDKRILGRRTGELISGILSNELEMTEEEYTIEINLMAFKLSRTVKKSKK